MDFLLGRRSGGWSGSVQGLVSSCEVGESVPEYTGWWASFPFHVNVFFTFPYPILALPVHACVNSSWSCCPSPYIYGQGAVNIAELGGREVQNLLKAFAYILPLSMAQEPYSIYTDNPQSICLFPAPPARSYLLFAALCGTDLCLAVSCQKPCK